MYRTISSDSLRVSNASYINETSTQPPKNTLCSDGCAGAVGAAGAAVVVLASFLGWLWHRWSKAADAAALKDIRAVNQQVARATPTARESRTSSPARLAHSAPRTISPFRTA